MAKVIIEKQLISALQPLTTENKYYSNVEKNVIIHLKMINGYVKKEVSKCSIKRR